MTSKTYYLGLDIGTDSIGYAVTNEDYKLLTFKKEALWGSCLFDPANDCASRRGMRTARRRLDRRQARIALLADFFAPAINEVDSKFFARLRESALYAEDRTDKTDNQSIFNDEAFKDADFYRRYPTVHHLIVDLMENPAPHDVRLVYLACAWMMAHRGHFLQELDVDNISKLTDIGEIYAEMMTALSVASVDEDGESVESAGPFWDCDPKAFGDILARRTSRTHKKEALLDLLFPGEAKPKNEGFRYDRLSVIELLCGFEKVKPAKLFKNDAYVDCDALNLAAEDEKLDAVIGQLGDDGELIRILKRVFDWAILKDVLHGCPTISKAKVAIYDQHAKDLAGLKAMLRKDDRSLFDRIFKTSRKGEDNYAAYVKNAKDGKTATREKFCEFLRKALTDYVPSAQDRAFYDDMMARLETDSFLPKQVNGENRVIPHQLYQAELRVILQNASAYLPFLRDADEYGTIAEKIEKTFAFRIPYYVGPLVSSEKSEFAWMVRKGEGKIRPWNFGKLVDLDKSEDAFIRRMTGKCTYLPGEDVLPADSLLYRLFNVLNEINPLKVNDVAVPVEVKQRIVDELFKAKAKVTAKSIERFLLKNGLAQPEDRMSGIDEEIKSSLKSYHAFKGWIDKKTLTEDEVEQVILRSACTTDALRFRKWLSERFADRIAERDIARMASIKCAEFGRFSRKFLSGIVFECKATGERGCVMDFLWRHNVVLMELLSDEYTLADRLDEFRRNFYADPANRMTLDRRLDEMYISSAVKRQVYRALDVVKTIVKVMGHPPAKVFVEMARGGTPDQKGKRTVSRSDQVRALLKSIRDDDARMVEKELKAMGDSADNRLQSDALFLWTMQLGHCAYCGRPLRIEELKNTANIDHIHPQCLVKDDSVLNNKVLCCSDCNGKKTDIYPVPASHRQDDLWAMWHDRSLMTDEKYRRLMRREPLTDAEKMGFINRQLVETRQTTKAVFTILGETMPESEIVAVKAGLVSDFRHEFKLVKCREVNDLHHAKDAYLNIAVGNVYHERFTRRFFRLQDGYSVKVETLFGKGSHIENAHGVAWNGGESLIHVKATVARNDIHLTKYALTNKGGFFDQMPKAGDDGGTIPRKKNLPVEKYGGYAKSTAAGYLPVAFSLGKKKDILILPVDLLDLGVVTNGPQEEANAKVRVALSSILGDKAVLLGYPLGRKILKVNTILELDGFPFVIRGKSGGGSSYLLGSLRSLVLSSEQEAYVKRLSSLREKLTKNAHLTIDSEYDKVTAERNASLYDVLAKAASSETFRKMPASQAKVLTCGEEKFRQLPIREQVFTLLNIVQLLKTNRAGGCDLTGVGGVAKAGVITISSKVSNWKKQYKKAFIVHSDFTGIYRAVSRNLLELV